MPNGMDPAAEGMAAKAREAHGEPTGDEVEVTFDQNPLVAELNAILEACSDGDKEILDGNSTIDAGDPNLRGAKLDVAIRWAINRLKKIRP